MNPQGIRVDGLVGEKQLVAIITSTCKISLMQLPIYTVRYLV